MIETHIENGQIVACVVVRKGTLSVNDTFVCGLSDGRVKFMRDDNGKTLKKVGPGRSVTIGGLKEIPEVGMPLYGVRDSEESKFIISQRNNRRAEEDSSRAQTPQLNKKVTKLTWLEKR